MWSDDNTETLRVMWMDGYSGGEIAAKLKCGLSRCAIMGKIRRLRLTDDEREQHQYAREQVHRFKQTQAARALRTARRKQRAKESNPPISSPFYSFKRRLAALTSPVPIRNDVQVPFECLSVTIADLNDAMCRWPIGDPKKDQFRYCGLPTRGSYCRFHSGLAYTEITDRKQKDQYLMRLT